jgi:hypothetical protein
MTLSAVAASGNQQWISTIGAGIRRAPEFSAHEGNLLHPTRSSAPSLTALHPLSRAQRTREKQPRVDDLYYVRSEKLAAYLVATPGGNILIDANLKTSPPQIPGALTPGLQGDESKTAGRSHIRPS